MKKDKFPNNHASKSADAPRSSGQLSRGEAGFAPSSDEVARKAYFSYLNEGSPPGRDVQHWLAAEAELIAERNRTRVHGFDNRT
jgi:Protein of unknown function (DUF2934)